MVVQEAYTRNHEQIHQGNAQELESAFKQLAADQLFDQVDFPVADVHVYLDPAAVQLLQLGNTACRALKAACIQLSEGDAEGAGVHLEFAQRTLERSHWPIKRFEALQDEKMKESLQVGIEMVYDLGLAGNEILVGNPERARLAIENVVEGLTEATRNFQTSESI